VKNDKAQQIGYLLKFTATNSSAFVFQLTNIFTHQQNGGKIYKNENTINTTNLIINIDMCHKITSMDNYLYLFNAVKRQNARLRWI